MNLKKNKTDFLELRNVTNLRIERLHYFSKAREKIDELHDKP